MENLLLQYIALCVYVLFMGFTFCDGFKLHIARKLIWFCAFLLVALPTFKSRGEFDLGLILLCQRSWHSYYAGIKTQ